MEPVEPPDTPAKLRFTILDGMVLIAGSAVCCLIPRIHEWSILRFDQTIQIMSRSSTWSTITVYWAMVASATLAALEAFGPRPSGSRRFRRPGALAMLMVAISWAYHEIQVGISIVRHHLTSDLTYMNESWEWVFAAVHDTSHAASLMVLGCWVGLILAGAWSPAKDWLDRSGRVVGGLWIIREFASRHVGDF